MGQSLDFPGYFPATMVVGVEIFGEGVGDVSGRAGDGWLYILNLQSSRLRLRKMTMMAHQNPR